MVASVWRRRPMRARAWRATCAGLRFAMGGLTLVYPVLLLVQEWHKRKYQPTPRSLRAAQRATGTVTPGRPLHRAPGARAAARAAGADHRSALRRDARPGARGLAALDHRGAGTDLPPAGDGARLCPGVVRARRGANGTLGRRPDRARLGSTVRRRPGGVAHRGGGGRRPALWRPVRPTA